MLVMQSLSKVFRTTEVETTALNAVDLGIAAGEFTAIMGPSGCGKSTLLNIIGMLDNPSSGRYFFLDEDVS
ncbi:MAG TPA: ATP-binding cassette domain-containing protein, partial [Gammaproteobacteria bacterium]|nr:ATP-binding cassette domain-containing protein [Gammaproteobacteria bacterium]